LASGPTPLSIVGDLNFDHSVKIPRKPDEWITFLPVFGPLNRSGWFWADSDPCPIVVFGSSGSIDRVSVDQA